ncbi:6-hydroxymethylpterin diphosphokinase MptE-like protein [Pseudoalteromonas maricaloris]
MEDEMMSLKHSSQNIKSLKNFKTSDFSFLESHKALIVGNGPSLDLIIDDINKFNGIVVSCGTSLPSLLRKNIVPHIHVEMERSKDGYYIKEDYLKSPLLKNTLLITLNTVYHKTLLTFENRLFFLK